MKTLYVILLGALCSGCATLARSSVYAVKINSDPKEASIQIINRKGKEVFTGKTPAVVRLKASSGYFERGIYSIHFEKEGFKKTTFTLRAGINGWYYGNFLIGGALGLLVIDPATGAMYRLKTEVNQSLEANESASTSLLIKSTDGLSAAEKKDLQRIY
jgi:hypothetical protein